MKENILRAISQSNPVSDFPPIQNLGSKSSQKFSDEFWFQTSELLDRVKASGSITVTKVSTGSQIEKSASQSPVLAEAPEKVTSSLKTASVHAKPLASTDPTPKVASELVPIDLSHGGRRVGKKFLIFIRIY